LWLDAKDLRALLRNEIRLSSFFLWFPTRFLGRLRLFIENRQWPSGICQVKGEMSRVKRSCNVASYHSQDPQGCIIEWSLLIVSILSCEVFRFFQNSHIKIKIFSERMLPFFFRNELRKWWKHHQGRETTAAGWWRRVGAFTSPQASKDQHRFSSSQNRICDT
jgi:hypothetical protein